MSIWTVKTSGYMQQVNIDKGRKEGHPQRRPTRPEKYLRVITYTESRRMLAPYSSTLYINNRSTPRLDIGYYQILTVAYT